MSITAIQSICIFIARHSNLFYVLTQFYSCLAINFDQFIDTAECGLSLTRYWTIEKKIINFYFSPLWICCNSPKWVPMPKQSILWPCSFKLKIVSSLISFDATIVRVLNHGILNRAATFSNVSRARHDK